MDRLTIIMSAVSTHPHWKVCLREGGGGRKGGGRRGREEGGRREWKNGDCDLVNDIGLLFDRIARLRDSTSNVRHQSSVGRGSEVLRCVCVGGDDGCVGPV